MNTDVIIEVPIYKDKLNSHEFNSLKRLFDIYKGKFHIGMFYPMGMDISYYKNNFEFDAETYLWDEHFITRRTYSNLLLSVGFYELFSSYKYIFIYQLDGWIFKDELQYWVDKGYDYIGAPYMSEYSFFYNHSNVSFKKYNGNGGVSLRNIQWMISNLNRISSLNLDLNYEPFEDLFISTYFEFINMPSFVECAKFSWNDSPDILYKVNNFELPFCCHGYLKYGYNFYKDFNLITYYK